MIEAGIRRDMGYQQTIIGVLVMSTLLASQRFIGQGKGEPMKALGGTSEPFLGATVMVYHMVEGGMQASCQYRERCKRHAKGIRFMYQWFRCEQYRNEQCGKCVTCYLL